MARTARYAWYTGRPRAPAAGAWVGASAAAAGQATQATRAPRGARAAPWYLPGSRRAARCSSPRPGGRGRRHWPPGWGGPAQLHRPSLTRAPRRRAGVRPRPGYWVRALPWPRGRTPPGPQSAGRLTGLIGGPPGGCRTGSRVRGPRTPCHPSHQGGEAIRYRPPRRPPPAGRTRERRRVGGGLRGPPCPGQWGGGAAPGPSPPSPPAGAGASAEPELRQDAPPQQPCLPSLAERPPASLPDVFGRISAALSSRAPPRRRPPPAGATTTPPQSRQDGGGHDARAPALPTGHGRRSGRGPPLPPH